MKETAVARRYAKAFAEKYSKEPGSLETVLSELRGFAEVFETNRQLRVVMLNPAISQPEKISVLDGILEKMGAGGKAKEMLAHVIVKNRLALVERMADEFEKISFEILGRVRVDVSTAVELSDKEKQDLVEKLSAITSKQAVADITVDPSLIGGIIARVGSVMYDGSIKNQLKALRIGLE